MIFTAIRKHFFLFSQNSKEKKLSIQKKMTIQKKNVIIKKWGYGGMVDATDLKSVDLFDREGSSPSIPIKSKKKTK